MKTYEAVSKGFLTRRTPVIIRIDGKAFHSFTKGMKRPFDEILIQTMQETTLELCKNIQNVKLGYTQSDEISLLMEDNKTLETQAFFDNNIQKICSITASMTTLYFNRIFRDNIDEDTENFEVYAKKFDKALFDARCFNIPREEVANYFIWRQGDCSRNSIQMLGRSQFSHKELDKLSCDMIQHKLITEKDINWNNLPIYQRRGTTIDQGMKLLKSVDKAGNNVESLRNFWKINKEAPIFSENRDYVENYWNWCIRNNIGYSK
jgi:tRNA(His) 5'-end guanylyltransferase